MFLGARVIKANDSTETFLMCVFTVVTVDVDVVQDVDVFIHVL